MTRRIRLHRFTDERGQSLVMALLVLTFLAISLGSVIFFTASNQRTSNYQKAVLTASSLAEAGINNAVSVLANPVNANNLETPWGTNTPAVLPDNSASHPAYTTSYSGCATGVKCVKWWGNLDTTQELWTLHGQATVPNPTGAAAIVKKMSAQVQVNAPDPKKIDVGVWNTIFSPGSLCGTNAWGQGVNVTVPVFVGGDLCLGQKAQINGPVYIGGNYSATNKQAQIGCAVLNGNGCQTSAPVAAAHVGGWCAGASGTHVSPCKSEPTNPNTQIWVQNPATWNPAAVPSQFVDSVTGQLITSPTICWAASTNCAGDPLGGWYNAASPGPMHSCDPTLSGANMLPASTFDNDTKFGPDEGALGGSVATPFNLTPDGVSYSCKTAQGELSWNATTRVLTVNGTVFIDGSVYAKTSGGPITYTGWGSCTTTKPCEGVIYVTGTVYITSEKLCALVDTSTQDCNWSGWNPNTKMLTFLANYQGTQSGVSAGQGIVVGPTQTSFQGALYANYQINTGQGASTQGPLVSGTQTVVIGQQFQGSFPNINILPVSIQGPPQGFNINPPMNFKYGG